LWEYSKDNAAFLLASVGYLVACIKYIVAPEGICGIAFVGGTFFTGKYPTMCGLVGSAATIYELSNTFSSEFSFLNYNQELKGEDYCASGNYQ